jgi:chromosome segregation ATPase
MNSTDTQTKLQNARQDLAKLEQDLAELTTIASNHETRHECLKTENAPVHQRLETRTQMTATQDLILEQHTAIKAAKTQVQTLEAELNHTRTLEGISELVKEMADNQNGFSSDLEALTPSLNAILEPVYARITKWREQQNGFKMLLGQIGIQRFAEHAMSSTAMLNHKQLESLLETLEARGVNITPLLMMNYHTRGLNALHRDLETYLPSTTAARVFTLWTNETEEAQLQALIREQETMKYARSTGKE